MSIFYLLFSNAYAAGPGFQKGLPHRQSLFGFLWLVFLWAAFDNKALPGVGKEDASL